MGFKCILNGSPLDSFAMSDTEWITLKDIYTSQQLISPCCNTAYIPKENSYGTRFFAHKSLNDCPYIDNTPKEHIYFKYLVSRSLFNLGWKVEHDKIITVSDRESITAGIYAEKGSLKFIFEVLWNDLTEEDTRKRHQAYLDLGIKSAWFLFRSSSKGAPYTAYRVLSERHVASFIFTFDKKEKKFLVNNIYKPIKQFKPQFIDQSTEVSEFLAGIFDGRIHVFGIPRKKYLLNLLLSPQTCFYCGNKTNIVQKAAYYAVYQNQPVQLKTLDIHEIPKEHLDALNHPDYRLQLGFGELGIRISEDMPTPRIRNSCAHCDAPQNTDYNIQLFSTKNTFESGYLEVGIPDDYAENPCLYVLTV